MEPLVTELQSWGLTSCLRAEGSQCLGSKACSKQLQKCSGRIEVYQYFLVFFHNYNLKVSKTISHVLAKQTEKLQLILR